MINCVPFGGISNRLKCVISSIVEYNDINLIWNIPSEGGVGCLFNDIYKNKFDGTSKQQVSSCEFIHTSMNTNNSGDKLMLDEVLKAKYINVIKSLEPVEYIQHRITEELNILQEFTTVSVRTFRSFPREYRKWGTHFNINELYKVMDNITGKILLTCDDIGTVNLLKDRYDIYITPKRTEFGDFKTIEGMQDILIDLYVGSQAKQIYGTNMSSFSELQWWLGECNSQYIGMNLHDN